MDEQGSVISPVDLRNAEFDRKMRGYDPEQVDSLLIQAAGSFELALSELNRLKSEVKECRAMLDEYKKIETTLKNTLVTTQGSVEELKKNAEQKAELILSEARMGATRILSEQEERLKEIRTEVERLKNFKTEYVIRLRSLIDSHRDMLLNQLHDESSRELSEMVTAAQKN